MPEKRQLWGWTPLTQDVFEDLERNRKGDFSGRDDPDVPGLGLYAHINPHFAKASGLAMFDGSWKYTYRLESGFLRRPLGFMVTLNMAGLRDLELYMDEDGGLVEAKVIQGKHPRKFDLVLPRHKVRYMPTLLLPTFRDETGNVLCPRCNQPHEYSLQVEWCKTHGRLARNTLQSLQDFGIDQARERELRWLQKRMVVARPKPRVNPNIVRDEQWVEHLLNMKEGDVCIHPDCPEQYHAQLESHGGTLKCPECWWRPAEKPYLKRPDY